MSNRGKASSLRDGIHRVSIREYRQFSAADVQAHGQGGFCDLVQPRHGEDQQQRGL